MAAPARGFIRIGPITLLSTVIIVCLSVLAVLSICTAIASSKDAENQSAHTASIYAEEKAGQEFIAQVDEALADSHSNGKGKDATLSALQQQLPSGTSVDDDGTVRIAFTDHNTHTLKITIRINDDLTYDVLEWKTITQWNETNLDTQLS